MQILCNQSAPSASNESMQIVESQTLETECLPFPSIPHTTRLFDDYLHNFDRVKRFYAQPPLRQDWWTDEIKKIEYPAERRKAVAAILERQNRGFGAGDKTFDNIQRLREGAVAVVTGQQVGLFGGPIFCILKALTAVTLAEKAGAVRILAGDGRPRSGRNQYGEPARGRSPAEIHGKRAAPGGRAGRLHYVYR